MEITIEQIENFIKNNSGDTINNIKQLMDELTESKRTLKRKCVEKGQYVKFMHKLDKKHSLDCPLWCVGNLPLTDKHLNHVELIGQVYKKGTKYITVRVVVENYEDDIPLQVMHLKNTYIKIDPTMIIDTTYSCKTNMRFLIGEPESISYYWLEGGTMYKEKYYGR